MAELLKMTYGDLKLNDRITISGDLIWDMVQAAGPQVIPEKQRLYQLAQRDKVPWLMARFTDTDVLPVALRGYVTLRLALVALESPDGDPDAYRTFVDVSHVLLEWLLDARTTNEHDDVRRYLLEQPPDQRRNNAPIPVNIEESFVYARIGNWPDFQWLRRAVLECTPLWDKLRERQHILNWLVQQDQAKRSWLVEAVHWAPYIKHVLYGQRQSLLYDAERWLGSSLFDIVVVGFDPTGGSIDETQRKSYWVSLLTRYRKENPNAEEETETSLSDRPHDFDVLSHNTISLVALDRRRPDRRMVGYVTCTLRTVHQLPAEQSEPFKSKELNFFVERLRENIQGQKRQLQRKDAAYDVFSVDGVHVHTDYRGAGLPKILIFYALEFIRLAHPVLGVSLLMAGAEAQATKAILDGSFGFSHFNCQKDLRWLWHQASQYYEVRRPPTRGERKKAGDSDVPLQLLTRAQLLRSLEQLLQPGKYNFVVHGLQRVHDSLKGVEAHLKQSQALSPQDPPLQENDTQAWPDPLLFMTPREFDVRVVEPLRRCVDDDDPGSVDDDGVDVNKGGPVERNAALGRAYHQRVNALLGTGGDNQDCFLFLGSGDHQYDGVALLSQKLLAFYDVYRGSGGGGGSNNENWVDEVFASRARTQKTTGASATPIGNRDLVGAHDIDVQQQERATDEDMALYTLWLQDEQRKKKQQTQQRHEPVIVSPPPTVRPPTTTIVLDLTKDDDDDEEERAVNEAVRVRKELRRVDQAYLRARTEHERQGAPLLETITAQFFKSMRAASPPDWSDQRVQAMARSTARLHLHKTDQHPEFPGRRDWVAQHYPHMSPYF